MKINKKKSMKILFPENITDYNSEKYNFSIRLCAGDLAFSGYIPDERCSFFYETAPLDLSISYIDALKNIFFENECMKYVYKSLNIICATEKYTIVPEDVYIKKHRKELFSLCLNPSENHKIMSQHIEEQNCIILFEIESEVYEFLVRSYVNVNFQHLLSPLLKVWQKASLEAYSKHVYVNVWKGVADILCFEHGNLVFANSFRYEKNTELLYFVVYVFKQIGFSQIEDELFLCGETEVCTSVIKVLKTYFEHITLLPGKMEKYESPVDQEIPFDIIKLTECGL
jgi:hypothetical protein